MRKVQLFAPALCFYLVIFILSSIKFKIEAGIPSLDKGVHFGEFAVLGFFLSLGIFLNLKTSLCSKVVWVFVSGTLLGGLIEICQYFLPARSFEILDLAADSLGILIGLIVFLFLSHTEKGKTFTERFFKTRE